MTMEALTEAVYYRDAKINALKGENSKLTERLAEQDSLMANWAHASKLDSEYVDQLKAENERLRDALRKIIRVNFATVDGGQVAWEIADEALSTEHPPSGSKP